MFYDRPCWTDEVTNNTREKRPSVMGLPVTSRAQEGQYPLGVLAGTTGFSHKETKGIGVCVWCEQHCI